MNVWKITPGSKGYLWDVFSENNCIGIGWSYEDYSVYNSLDEVKEDYEKNSANCIWNFYNKIKEGDWVVANKGKDAVLGIGIIKSDYIGPNHKENLNLEYEHIRKVDWKIKDEIPIHFSNQAKRFDNKTITPISETKWEEIKKAYINQNPEYETVFSNSINGIKKYQSRSHLVHYPIFSKIDNILNRSKNLILYGPPGTGKTFLTAKYLEYFLKDQINEPQSKEKLLLEAIENLAWYQVIALAIYTESKDEKIKVRNLKKTQIIQDYFSIIKNRKDNIDNTLWSILSSHASPESETVKHQNKYEPFLFDKTSESEWYLTSEGIEYVKEELNHAISTIGGEIDQERSFEQYSDFITFHQSYAYEEFIEGLKPVPDDEDPSIVNYQVVPGIFSEICRKAEADNTKKYVLIIDEINRGNIAKIFGELITFLEDDKRINESNNFPVVLPYSKRKFGIPNNLYIIGTMNTSDRSIALLDIALRRRFTFLEIMPDPELLKDVIIDGIDLSSLLKTLNMRISGLIDTDHQIGHSYLLRIKSELEKYGEEEAKEELLFVWYRKIIPLLKEYFYNDGGRLGTVLGSGFVKENKDSLAEDGIYNNGVFDILEYDIDKWANFKDAMNKIIITSSESGESVDDENTENGDDS